MKNGKRVVALLLALLTLALSGCGVFSTKMARAVQKMSKLSSLHMDLACDVELTLAFGGRELPAEGHVLAAADLIPDPLLAEVELYIELPGTERLNRYFFEKDDEAVTVYSNVNGGSVWEKRAIVPQGTSGEVSALRYIVDGAETFEPAGSETVDGVTATRYDGVITADFISGLAALYELKERLGEGYGLTLPDDLFDGLPDVPASLWIADNGGALVAARLELGAFADGLAERLLESVRRESGAAAAGLDMHLTAVTAELYLSEFDAVEKPVIPDEAKAAWGEELQPWD